MAVRQTEAGSGLYLRRCLVEIYYWTSKRCGTCRTYNYKVLFIRLLYLFGRGCSVGNARVITNLLRSNTAHFIVGIMQFYGQGSVYRSMLYFRRGLHGILIRIIFKQTAEVNQVFPTTCRVTGSFMASHILSTIDRKCNHLNLNCSCQD